MLLGYDVFFNWDISRFLTSCKTHPSSHERLLTPAFCVDINIPLFLGFYLGFKWWYRTEIWRSDEIDFVTGVPTLEETETPPRIPRNVWEKIGNAIF